MGKKNKNRKEGKKGRGDLEEWGEDYMPSNTEDNHEMHSDSKEKDSPQHIFGKRITKMERKEKKVLIQPK